MPIRFAENANWSMGSVQTELAPKLYMLTRRTPNNTKPRIMSIDSMRCPGSMGPSPATGGLVTDASVGLVTWEHFVPVAF
jgi:hypothetical protein